VPKISGASHRREIKNTKYIDFQWFFAVCAVGISQAEDVLSEQKHLTKTKPKGKL